LPEEAYDFDQAFAADTMIFALSLQFVLIPRVHQILEQQETFPAASMVGVKAIREFDGYENAARLGSLLGKFDRLFNWG
jgi:uncharacterized protein YqcC (DUF446 family)